MLKKHLACILSLAMVLVFVTGCSNTSVQAGAPMSSAVNDELSLTNLNAGSNTNVESGSRMPGGMTHAPDGIPQAITKTEINTEKPTIEIIVGSTAAVDLIPTSGNEIFIEYPDSLYDVAIENNNGELKITIDYIGKYSVYPAAVVSIPCIEYGGVNIQAEMATISAKSVFQAGGNITLDMQYCSAFITCPSEFLGTYNIKAPYCYLEISSDDNFKNSDVRITNCTTFENESGIFEAQGQNSYTYANGTQKGRIVIDDSAYLIAK